MKITKIKILLLLFLLIGMEAKAKTEKYRCIWREDPATTMTIGWNQLSGTNPVVYYGRSDFGIVYSRYAKSQKPDRKINAKGMKNHFVRLRNLQPNTKYYFVIKDSEGISKRFWFRTAPDNPYERISIVAGGDSRNHRVGRQNANRIVSKLRPTFVLFAGDMTGSDNITQWRAWFEDWQLTITKDGKMTPIIPARGNHEYSNKTIVDMFDAPNGNIYYALNIGGSLLRVYTLNSMMAAGGDQYHWLSSDLQSKGKHKLWRFAQYHHPIRPHTAKKAERQSGYKYWGKLFYQENVQLVLECDAHVCKTTWPIRPSYAKGHDEGFVRDPGGTVYVGEGCWGAPLRPVNDDKRWTRNSGSFNQVKWIFVDQNKVETRTIKTDNAKSVAALSENDNFRIPSGLNIWKPSNGSVITINRSKHLAARSGKTIPKAEVSKPKSSKTTSKKTIPTTIGTKPTVKKMPRKPAVQKSVQKELQVANFKTAWEDNKVKLRWVTISEPNKVLCEVQRSSTGFDYTTISNLTFTGGDKIERSYLIKDAAIDAANTPFLFYRLKYTFPDKSEKISSKKSIKITDWKNFDLLAVDPEKNAVFVEYKLTTTTNVTLVVYDERGNVKLQRLMTNQVAGDHLQRIDIAFFQEGAYLIGVEGGKERFYWRFAK